MLSTIIRSGTIVTSERAFKADVLFHATVETAGVVG